MSRATNTKTVAAALGLTIANMTPAEHVAQRTWSTLGRANRLRARFGEETLTDLLVLDMLPHRRARGFWLLSTTKKNRGFVRCRPLRRRPPSHRPLVPLRRPGQEAVSKRRLQDTQRRPEVHQPIGQARTVCAAAMRTAPLPPLQPLKHGTALQTLALRPAIRERSVGLHACPELAHSAHDPRSPPAGLRSSAQNQSVVALALRFRLSRRRDATVPDGIWRSVLQS